MNHYQVKPYGQPRDRGGPYQLHGVAQALLCGLSLHVHDTRLVLDHHVHDCNYKGAPSPTTQYMCHGAIHVPSPTTYEEHHYQGATDNHKYLIIRIDGHSGPQIGNVASRWVLGGRRARDHILPPCRNAHQLCHLHKSLRHNAECGSFSHLVT